MIEKKFIRLEEIFIFHKISQQASRRSEKLGSNFKLRLLVKVTVEKKFVRPEEIERFPKKVRGCRELEKPEIWKRDEQEDKRKRIGSLKRIEQRRKEN